jgi:chromate transporter
MSEIDPPRESELDPPREKVSLVELAWTFNHIALASFGGGLSAWSREVLVVEKQWMGEAEFLSAMTMCRILPGANQVNMAVFAGSKMRRLRRGGGAVRAVPDAGRPDHGGGLLLFSVQGDARREGRPARRLGSRRRADAGDGHPNREEVPDGTDAGLALRCGVRPERHSRWPLPVVLAILAPISLVWAWPKEQPT